PKSVREVSSSTKISTQPLIQPTSAASAASVKNSIDAAKPNMPIAVTGRRPQLFDRAPQNGAVTTQIAADSEKIAPAVQSGRSSARVSGGRTAAVSMVFPAPTASRQKNSSRNAPRRSGRLAPGAFDVTGGC